ncbi:MAG TPA: hypothetical protein VKM54_24500 [Myxococcota bacterium]|nr:hypothetical protein [Myxococcota bacterium]
MRAAPRRALEAAPPQASLPVGRTLEEVYGLILTTWLLLPHLVA